MEQLHNRQQADFAHEFERCIINLADEVYGLSEPKEIAQRVLRKACEFYDADWCGIFDADTMLKLWMPFWWYNRATDGMTKTKTDMDQYGIFGELPRWKNAIEQNIPIIIKDVETLKETIPDEYNIFIRQEVKSILAVPFNKREKGVLLLRNPKRYGEQPELLRVMANIVIQEVNEQKLLDRMKLESCADCTDDTYQIVINLFGGLSICAERGKLTEAEIKSPLCCKIFVLLLLNRKRGMSARELSEHLWADKEYDNPTRNLRALLFRLRTILHDIMVNELMELLHSEKQYNKLYEYAMMTVGIDPESPITIYWLVVALRLHGAAEMAKRHLESAKLRMLEEEYKELEARLILE